MDMINKITILMEEQDLNKADLSKRTSIPYTTIDGLFKKGTENIKRSTLLKLAHYFGVTVDYLANDDIVDKNYNKTAGFQVKYNEMMLIKKIRALDEKSKGSLETLVEYFYDYTDTVKKMSGRGTTRTIPYYRTPASAGGGEYLDSGDRETIEIPRVSKYDEVDYAVLVNGDSMEPTFYSGDIALIRQQSSLDFGDIGLFILNNEGYIKKYDRAGLVSLNKKYGVIKVKEYDSFKISGKVIGALGKMED